MRTPRTKHKQQSNRMTSTLLQAPSRRPPTKPGPLADAPRSLGPPQLHLVRSSLRKRCPSAAPLAEDPRRLVLQATRAAASDSPIITASGLLGAIAPRSAGERAQPPIRASVTSIRGTANQMRASPGWCYPPAAAAKSAGIGWPAGPSSPIPSAASTPNSMVSARNRRAAGTSAATL